MAVYLTEKPGNWVLGAASAPTLGHKLSSPDGPTGRPEEGVQPIRHADHLHLTCWGTFLSVPLVPILTPALTPSPVPALILTPIPAPAPSPVPVPILIPALVPVPVPILLTITPCQTTTTN